MKINNIPSNIGEFLKYDDTSSTGLRWVKKFCNKINVGDYAGCLNTRTNYYYTGFAGKLFKNHRIIFFLNYGYCPACIDHIDNVRTNNQISNLRVATLSQNMHNRKINSKNKSGHKGVSLQSKGKYQYWHVQIMKNCKRVISKTFPLSQFQEACDFSDEQRQILHGDFSNNGETL